MTEEEQIEKSLQEWKDRRSKFMYPHIPEMNKCCPPPCNRKKENNCYESE